MKKNLLLILMAALSLAAFPACEKNNQEEEKQHDTLLDEDQTKITAFNSLEWLQGSIVAVNSNGDVVRRIYGKPLDESQPDVIYAPVKNTEIAEATFLEWIAPGKEPKKVDGGYDYFLTDEDGKSQGNVSFRYVNDSDKGILAEMRVGDGTDLKQVSQVNFISNDLWPENDVVEKYEVGKTYTFDTIVLSWLWSRNESDYIGEAETSKQLFYCVQSNDDGKDAILVWLCPDYDYEECHPRPSAYIRNELYNYLPTVPQAKKVLDFYNAHSDVWNKMEKDMDALGLAWSPQSGYATTGDSEFLLNSYDGKKIKCLNLNDDEKGEICEVKKGSWFKYRYMHVLFFPPYTEE